MTFKLWQLLVLTALPALLVGVLIGSYALPHGNNAEAGFYKRLNAAYDSRQANRTNEGQVAAEIATSAAQAHVRAAVPALEAYNADHGGYGGVTVGGLQQSYDAGIRDITIVRADASTYCVESGSGSVVYHKVGPAGDIVRGACPA